MRSEQAVEDYLHREIPLSAAMQVRVVSAAPNRVELSAPLAPNINHRDTVFGGSAVSVATLACWTLLHERMMAANLAAHLVIQRAGMEYLKPIAGDFRAVASLDSDAPWTRLERSFQKAGKARISLTSELFYDDAVVGAFTGDFVMVSPR